MTDRAQQDCAPTIGGFESLVGAQTCCAHCDLAAPLEVCDASIPPMHPRQTGALHRHRWSHPEVTYFVTCCTEGRRAGLSATGVARPLCEIIGAADVCADVVTHAFTIMPDHLHWLFTLGERLALGRVVARFKAQSRGVLAVADLRWQRDFFEHRLRGDERMEAYGQYVFLNPYRAGLISAGQCWPHWGCPRPDLFRFTALLNPDGSPPRKWVDEPVPTGLAIGE